MKINIQFPLKKHNTFRLDVVADEFIEFDSLEQLKKIFIHVDKQKWYILGGGSNTLFTKNFEGVIIHPIAKDISIVHHDEKSVTINAMAGVVWDDFVKWCVDRDFYGAENLSHIPGSVGASAVQNIGAYGVEAKDIITEVEVYLPKEDKVVVYSNSQCEFEYRDSIFKNNLKNNAVVLSINFVLSKFFAPNISYGNLSELLDKQQPITAKSLRETIIKIRDEKLPDTKILGNGGSFFKNPVVEKTIADSLLEQYPYMPHYNDKNGVKIPAAWLIEQCGWKGKAIGEAAIHENQALVIVNLGYAKPEDIILLSKRVINDVKSKFGIDIYPEINIVK